MLQDLCRRSYTLRKTLNTLTTSPFACRVAIVGWIATGGCSADAQSITWVSWLTFANAILVWQNSAMTIPLTALSNVVVAACTRLRDGLLEILGDDIVALWVYGASVIANPTDRLGDVDTHCILRAPISGETGAWIDALHRCIELNLGIEFDGWYVVLADALRPEVPTHAFRPGLIDESWALHRAHLLAGRCAVVHGADPRTILPRPTWPELESALGHELRYIEEHLDRLQTAWVAPYVVCNCCRIVYSFETRDVVTSKRESVGWALKVFPDRWHNLVRAAARWYERTEEPRDPALLREQAPAFVAFTKQRIG